VLNPLIGKSVVVYAAKPAEVAGRVMGRRTVHSRRAGASNGQGEAPAAAGRQPEEAHASA
jgi:hypothetical protein